MELFCLPFAGFFVDFAARIDLAVNVDRAQIREALGDELDVVDERRPQQHAFEARTEPTTEQREQALRWKKERGMFLSAENEGFLATREAPSHEVA